jgi:uncharacterized protein involved in exopolysaccharide biosynthesis
MYIEPSLRGLLMVFYRRKAKFNAVFALIMLVGVIYLMGMSRVYEAHGSFLIKPASSVPEAGRQGAADDGTPAARTELVQSNIKILLSDDLLGAVVSKVGVERLYPGIKDAVGGTDSPEHEAVTRLQMKDLKATNDAESNIVEIAVRNKDPQVAKDFAQTLIEMFIAKQTEIYSAPHSDFLEKQIAETQQKLQEAQKQFQGFKQKTGISNLDQEVTELLTEKSALSGLSLQAVTVSQESLSKQESDLAAARATYRPDSPILQRLNDSLAVAKRDVSRRQQDLNATGGNGSALSPKIAKIEKRMAYLEKNRSEYTQLEENVTMSQDDYKTYRQQGEEARGHELLNQQGITRISIVDKPVVPLKAEPLKRKILLIAILLTALLFGLGIVIFFELMDESVAYPEQIAVDIGLPVLGSFGQTQTDGAQTDRAQTRRAKIGQRQIGRTQTA